jgi:NADH-quinone oxidoreductase subunit C
MFGIYFSGNWNLKRILTDYGFIGKPLRKDFPVVGYVELVFDDSNKTIKFESIQLIQKFRSFEFNNPWF